MKPIDGQRESRGGRRDAQVPLYKHRRHKCNGCTRIFDCVPCPHTQRREEVFCSPKCEEKSKEAPRDQFDPYTRASVTFRQAGGGRNTGKGRQGFACSRPGCHNEAANLAKLGFLTKEESGFRVVDGMKVHIAEKRN